MNLMMNLPHVLAVIAFACLLSQGCSSKADHPVPAPTPAAKVDNRVKESDLTRVTLTPEAEKRLGIELAEAVEKSLRRRRTVDVHFDSGSERGVFKSQMTAIGCGVLMFMMFGMIAYLIVAQLKDLPKWALHIARLLWITPLVIFLIAQALLPVARSRASNK